MEPIIAFFVIESISMVVGIRGSGGLKFPKLGKIRQAVEYLLAASHRPVDDIPENVF